MGFSVQHFMREFDLFSKPFIFFVGDKKSKSTLIGGVLSLSILIVSVIYFYYLINMYFSNQVEPKITSIIKIENQMSTINISYNFFIMEMLIQGEPLKKYEKRVGKQFLTYNVYYEQYKSDGTSQYETLPLSECVDPEFDGYLCVSAEAFQSSKDIYLDPINQISSDYSIMVTPCDPSQTDNCATADEIEQTIFQSTNYFQVFTSIRQYNSSKRQYENGFKSEFFYFDPKIIAYTRMSLIKATTSVIEGMIIQQTETNDTIYDYKRIDTYFTKDGVYERMGIDGYAYIVFELNQVHNSIIIQHAMITEVLAQFMSIFNSMLTIGIIARLLAESHIVEDMNNILLKEYYKQTALRLVKRQEGKKKMIKISNNLLPSKYEASQSQKKIQKVSSEKTEQSDELDKSHLIAELQQKICETNFAEKQRKYFEIGFWERIKITVLSLFGKHSIGNLSDDTNSDPTVYRSLLKQSMKRINIFEVYKDLIKLKMAIKLILTKEQYAAVHFCGSDIAQDVIPQKEIKIKEQEINNLSISQSNQYPPLSIEGKNLNDIFTPKNKQNILKSIDFGKEEQELNIHLSIASSQNYNNEKGSIALSRITEQIDETSQYNIPSNVLNDKNEQQKSQCDQKEIVSSQELLNSINKRQLQKHQTVQNKKSIPQLIEPIQKNNQLNQKVQNQISIEMRDRIQSLNIKGDENILQNSEISIDIQQQDGKEKEIQIQGEIENLQKNEIDKLSSIRLHLYDMDKIEEDVVQQEKFLKLFLTKMKLAINSQNIESISHIDQQIYSSLLTNDSHLVDFRTFPDQLQTNREIAPSICKPTRVSKSVIEVEQKQNSKNNQLNLKKE